MSIGALSSAETSLFRIVSIVRQLTEGRTNATGSFTVAASAASTTVTAPSCGTGSVVLLSSKTANAAAEIKNGTIYVTSVANGSFVVANANNAQTDRTFGFVCLG